MKAFRVNDKGSPACLEKCVPCRGRIKVGDVVLAMENRAARYGQKTQYAHKRCVLRLLERAGEDQGERAFNDLRDLISTTGEVFPRAT